MRRKIIAAFHELSFREAILLSFLIILLHLEAIGLFNKIKLLLCTLLYLKTLLRVLIGEKGDLDCLLPRCDITLLQIAIQEHFPWHIITLSKCLFTSLLAHFKLWIPLSIRTRLIRSSWRSRIFEICRKFLFFRDNCLGNQLEIVSFRKFFASLSESFWIEVSAGSGVLGHSFKLACFGYYCEFLAYFAYIQVFCALRAGTVAFYAAVRAFVQEICCWSCIFFYLAVVEGSYLFLSLLF